MGQASPLFDNARMRIEFTKMQGAGNDFVVLDETRGPLGLTAAHYRYLGDRHFGVGADQILSVRPSPGEGIDFEYRIHNADGQEVEQCGNGARCFARFVHERGLSTKTVLRVQTQKGLISPELCADGRVRVNMGEPRFANADIPFEPKDSEPVAENHGQKWPLPLAPIEFDAPICVANVNMGNPHAVILVDDVQSAPVERWGPWVQRSGHYPQGVNVGFMHIRQRGAVDLRVYERGVGETLACGSGACAAVVAGIRLGLLDASVDVHTRGGVLTIAWGGACDSGWAPVMMTGPATTVFHGVIELPEHL